MSPTNGFNEYKLTILHQLENLNESVKVLDNKIDQLTLDIVSLKNTGDKVKSLENKVNTHSKSLNKIKLKLGLVCGGVIILGKILLDVIPKYLFAGN